VYYPDEHLEFVGEAWKTASPARLAELAHHINPFVVGSAMRNKVCPCSTELQTKVLRTNKNSLVWRAIAGVATSESLLREIFSLRHLDGWLCLCLAGNPSLLADLGEELSRENADSWLLPHALFFNPSTSNALRKEILERIEKREGHLDLKDYEVGVMRKWLAHKELEN